MIAPTRWPTRFARFGSLSLRAVAVGAVAFGASISSAQRSSPMDPGAGGISQRLQDNASQAPEQLVDVTVADRLGSKVDGSITLTNSLGETVRLSDFLDGTKPVVLAMVYYSCPVVCPTTLTKLQQCFNELEFTIGDEFRVLIVSFNPDETSQLAASVKENELMQYRRGATQSVRDNWTFSVASEGNSKALGEQVGFQFKRLYNGEYSHPVSTIFLTPDGTVSRYIHGFELPKRDVELALIEASDGTISKDFGHMVATFCYRFDPASGSYALSAFRVMQLGGILTVLFLVALIGGLFFRERLVRSRTAASASSADRSSVAPLAAPAAGSHS